MGEENAAPMRINGVEGAAGEVKISGGPGVLESWGAVATKEFFVPVTGGTEMATSGLIIGARIDASNKQALVGCHIPHDFSSIVEAVIIRLAVSAATHRFNYYSNYGAEGEDFNTHSESLLDQDTAETGNIVYEQDISGILSSVVAGDYANIKIVGDATNVPNNWIVGLRFKYS